mmetsp:Transcript_95539/g.270085  ORF Transcript_95539/g.270085 Transcript_95539/m.270085 type:complete len:323 (-) Transcript_95539:70-1038(-)
MMAESSGGSSKHCSMLNEGRSVGTSRRSVPRATCLPLASTMRLRMSFWPPATSSTSTSAALELSRSEGSLSSAVAASTESGMVVSTGTGGSRNRRKPWKHKLAVSRMAHVTRSSPLSNGSRHSPQCAAMFSWTCPSTDPSSSCAASCALLMRVSSVPSSKLRSCSFPVSSGSARSQPSTVRAPNALVTKVTRQKHSLLARALAMRSVGSMCPDSHTAQHNACALPSWVGQRVGEILSVFATRSLPFILRLTHPSRGPEPDSLLKWRRSPLSSSSARAEPQARRPPATSADASALPSRTTIPSFFPPTTCQTCPTIWRPSQST